MDAVSALNDLRRRVLAGEEVTSAEYEEILTAVRGQRRSAAPAKSAPKTTKSKSEGVANLPTTSTGAIDLDKLV